MPPKMANSNEGRDHKDKYFDISRKILSQEMTIWNMEPLVSYFSEVMTNVIFFNCSIVETKILSTYKTRNVSETSMPPMVQNSGLSSL